MAFDVVTAAVAIIPVGVIGAFAFGEYQGWKRRQPAYTNERIWGEVHTSSSLGRRKEIVTFDSVDQARAWYNNQKSKADQIMIFHKKEHSSHVEPLASYTAM